MTLPEFFPRNPEEHPSNNPPLVFSIMSFDNDSETEPTRLVPTRVIQGGMSRVYVCPISEARQERYECQALAIKKPREWTEVGAIQRLYLREAVLWSAIPAHPNILPVIDVSTALVQPSITLPFRQRSVRDILSSLSPISTQKVYSIGYAVLSALEHAEKAWGGFSHGDIKPENILFDGDDTPQLSDFGLASAALAGKAKLGPISGGTRAYMAPEIRNGSRNSTSSDMFSLAQTLLELSVRQVIPASARFRVKRRLARKRFHSIIQRTRSDLSPDFLELLYTMLSEEADERPDIAQCLNTLRAAGQINPSVETLGAPVQPSAATALNVSARLRQLGYPEEAQAHAQRAENLASTPDLLALARVRLADVLIALGRLNEASAKLDEVDAFASNLPKLYRCEYLTTRAACEVARGRIRESLPYSRESVSLFPNQGSLYALGWTLVQLGDNEEAARVLGKAAETSVVPDIHVMLTAALWDSRQREAAISAIDRAADLHPGSGHIRGTRAAISILASMSGSKRAVDQWREDVAIAHSDPSTPPATREWLYSLLAQDIVLEHLKGSGWI